ncbi:MAG: PD-(D/E)XK nuclease family protein [Planctomycetes bacterium]|nr:PD-(D/E)XK nuclease family protein [Planctomycetota bacterium]
MTAALAELHPNAAAERISGRDYVSYSALALYARCPLRYFFRSVEGLPEEIISSSLAFGGGIHAAIELWFNLRMVGEREPDHDALLTEFWAAWRDKNEQATITFGKGESVNTIGRMADRVLTAFRESELARPAGTVIGVEEELRGPVVAGVPDVLARLDLLVETESALTVTDFKTARSRWGGAQAEDQAEQLLLYSELVRQLAPGKSVRLEFAVLTKAKSPAVDRHRVSLDPHRIQRTRRIVERVWRTIEAGHFYPAPSPMNCPSCPYRRPCRDWKG